jgi:hypothetical protein
MKTEYEFGSLRGTSISTDSVEKISGKNYDFVLLSSSWDQRCIEVSKRNDITSSKAVLLDFKGRDQHKYRDRHDPILKSYLKEISSEPIILSDYSENLRVYWKKIFDCVIETVKAKGRPINTFVDISTCPKYFSLGILSALFHLGICNTIDLFYCEGLYEQKNMNEMHANKKTFTFGKWETVPVPFSKNVHDPVKRKYYLVSVGFEGAKTMRIIRAKDPDRLSILFPDPGITKEYVKHCLKENRDLFESYRLTKKQIIRTNAADAILAWKKLSDFNLEMPEKENIHYLCCGTSPHSVALALRSITTGFATLLYRKPDRHSFIEVKPAGNYWQYTIKDLAIR